MQLSLGEIDVDVTLKDIKNVHLSVHPPTGRVHISAPKRMSLNTIRVFAISKLDWIKQQRNKFRRQERETPREYVNRESHYVWGKRYLLKVIENATRPAVDLRHGEIHLHIHPAIRDERTQDILEAWYREEVKEAVPQLIEKWEPVIGVKVNRFFVQRMKTKWGSCSPDSQNIRLNTDLAKKPPECLEYIVVHEMIHLLEPTHNSRFMMFMDQFMPHWRFHREELNRLPVRHQKWEY